MTSSEDIEVRRIRCQSLEVVDAAGKVRLKLGNVGALGDYTTALSIYGGGGEERVSLGVHGDGPFLSFASGDAGVIDLYVLDPGEVNGLGASHFVMSDGRGDPLVNVVVPLRPEGLWPRNAGDRLEPTSPRKGLLARLRKRVGR